MNQFFVQVKQDARFKIITAFGGIEVTKHFPVAIEDDAEGKNREEAERHEYLEIVSAPSERSSARADKATEKKSSARTSAGKSKGKTGKKSEESLAASKPEEDEQLFNLSGAR